MKETMLIGRSDFGEVSKRRISTSLTVRSWMLRRACIIMVRGIITRS